MLLTAAPIAHNETNPYWHRRSSDAILWMKHLSLTLQLLAANTMPEDISLKKTFTMPTIWPETLIQALIKKHPKLSFSKTKEILLQTPSIVLPEVILPKFDLAFHLIRNKRHASDAQPGDILAEVDLFITALKIAWPEKATQLECSKQEIISLYQNGGWVE
jgi:hypothetical protein